MPRVSIGPSIRTGWLAVAVAALATPAAALTIENQDKAELKVGIDEGAAEHIESIAAGKTGDLSAKCKEGCGLPDPGAFPGWPSPATSLSSTTAN